MQMLRVTADNKDQSIDQTGMLLQIFPSIL